MTTFHTQAARRRAAAVLIAIGLVLIAVAAVHATQRGWWDSTEFQVINLDSVPAPFTASFLDIGGAEVYTFTDTLPPAGTRFYRPEDMDPPLDPEFAGTLAVYSEQHLASLILHRDEPGGGLLDGNTTFDVAADWPAGAAARPLSAASPVTQASFPVDVCTVVIVQNAGTIDTTVATYIFDTMGDLIGQDIGNIAPGAALSLRLSLLVPSLLHGGALVEATEPVNITILRSCLGLTGAGAYSPLPEAGTSWMIPQFFPSQLGLGRASYLKLQNASTFEWAEVTVTCPCGATDTYWLPPLAGAEVLGPSGAAIGPLFVSSTVPIAAAVLTQFELIDRGPDPAGDYIYSAFDPAQATNAVALPVLLRDYEGWSTDSGIMVQNLGTKAATMHMRVVTTDGQTYYDQGTVLPGMVWTPLPPAIAYEHAAATVWADAPIMALVTLRKEGLLDGWMGYRGINFSPAAPDASFAADPPAGCEPLDVQFTDTSLGDPVEWAWDFGDGQGAFVQNPAHTFAEDGAYTVVLTATNAGGSDSASGPMTVYDTPEASFTVAGGPYHAGQPIAFADTTPGEHTDLWQFSDGATYTVPNPIHTFAAPGPYLVRLTATTAHGCTDSAADELTVLPAVPSLKFYLPVVVKGG